METMLMTVKPLIDGPTMQEGQKEKKANGDSVRKDTSSKEREITMPLSSSTGIIPNTSNEDLPNMHKKTMIMLCGMSNFIYRNSTQTHCPIMKKQFG
jgi:hypothetical protein